MKSEKPILYSFRRCPYAMRARLALVYSQVQVELREIVLRDKPDEMLQASPKGTVPVLIEVDGQVVDESYDIMLWALKQNDPLALMQPQGCDFDEMLSLIQRNDHDFKSHLDRYKYPGRYDWVNALEHRDEGSEFLLLLDQKLSTQSHLFGSAISLADIAIAPFVRQFAHVDRDWFYGQPWERLIGWLTAFLNTSEFKIVMKKYAPWKEHRQIVFFPDVEK